MARINQEGNLVKPIKESDGGSGEEAEDYTGRKIKRHFQCTGSKVAFLSAKKLECGRCCLPWRKQILLSCIPPGNWSNQIVCL